MPRFQSVSNRSKDCTEHWRGFKAARVSPTVGDRIAEVRNPARDSSLNCWARSQLRSKREKDLEASTEEATSTSSTNLSGVDEHLGASSLPPPSIPVSLGEDQERTRGAVLGKDGWTVRRQASAEMEWKEGARPARNNGGERTGVSKKPDTGCTFPIVDQ